MTEGEENIIIKGVLLEAISRDFSEELSNNKEVSVSNKSADILARIFCGHYERPGVPKISERVANAKKWYNFL